MSARRRRPPRDQAESPFNVILEDFLTHVRFARGAAIVDSEGETVDYAGDIDPFELRVAAATFGLVMNEIKSCQQLSASDRFSVRMGKSGYQVVELDPHYSLLVLLRTLGTFCVSQRLIEEIKHRILIEAGLPRRGRLVWRRVEVWPPGKGSRPQRLREARSLVDVPFAPDEGWAMLEVLGTLVATAAKERGYRVRMGTGAELTLLREASGLWFIDESVEAAVRGDAAGRKELFAPTVTGAAPSGTAAAPRPR